MLGAIAGDMVGSVYEWRNHRSTEFELFGADARFTDDTVLTVAIADALLSGNDYAASLRRWYHRYPAAGYGKRFAAWAAGADEHGYNSWGNGSAMRVSPVGHVARDVDEAMSLAAATAVPTHDHPEGIKGAQAIATAVCMARLGEGKERIRQWCETRFGYDLSFSLAGIRPHYRFDVSCQGSVPQAVVAFLEARDFEEALRNAVSIGGDSDTIACMAGAIAEAHFGVPGWILDATRRRLDVALLEVVDAFTATFMRR